MTREELLSARCVISVGRTFAIVDPEDYDVIRSRTWELKKRANGTLFAQTRIKNEQGLQVWYLHHAVCTRAYGHRASADQCCQAVNGDSLDCRRANLRWRDKMGMKLEAMRSGKARKRAA